MGFDKNSFLQAFPFQEIRPVQEDALTKVAKTIEAGKRFTVLEAPVGSGKSAVAVAIGMASACVPKIDNFEPGAHITTTQIVLQQQYMRDFQEPPVMMAEIKGKSNYQCCYYTDEAVDCQTSQALRPKEDHCGDACNYTIARQNYLNTPIGITNFAYFTTVRKAAGDHGLPSRHVLIVDEAHNTESGLIGLGEIDISGTRLETLQIPKILSFKEDQSYSSRISEAQKWLGDVVLPQAKIKRLEFLAKANRAPDKPTAIRNIRLAESMEHFKGKIEMFLGSDPIQDPWVVFNQLSPQGRAEGLVLKPLFANNLAEQYLFSAGRYVVMMSATILGPQVFTKNLGIGPDDYGFKRFASDFPVSNRPVLYDPVGSMSFKNIDKTLPKMVREVVEISKKHPDQKGIIHTNSYKVNKAVVAALLDAGLSTRVLSHSNEKGSRDKAVKAHIESPYPTILISPSLTEGLDLKDDLSRWQIMVKVPYPSLGDAWIRARLEENSEWYACRTGLTLMQASGRSIRSKEDYAETYILDSDFGRFMHQSGYLFPGWWKDAIQEYRN